MIQLRIATLLVTFLAFANLNECINALPLCWNFDSGSSGWFNAGTASGAYLWKFSAGGKPADTSNIPSFYSTSPYAFFQDQDTPPVEGTLCSPTIAGVGTGSTITLTVFRHIIETHLNDSSRPLLRFVEGGVSHNIEFDYNYDRWDTVTATCGTSAICCSTSFPCNGMLCLDGVVYVRDELIAVDEVCVI